MPVYDYACEACGPFTVLRPMAQFRDPHDCPDCGAACGRAFLTAPNLASMDAGRRKAFATNERSAHAPRKSSAHGAGCGCCSGTKAKSNPTAAKSFPNARPWMISH
ncbi:zinc ribbon domain-containing protein [Methylobacterium sp. E-041]|jgi:putative FmdB family regulatory protein|uniref:FmdB family zinc ribbon protein n=1 Tax=unclassified Methylobacterium TaxID=2615210 RepID=UPI0011C9D9C6|nr:MULTISPECIES: zinc ribbon domain-containing protein [unclassified Methylobacterium]RZK98330.1 MAG: zinc ribbon domain-containing protein [Methylobacterium sp.]MCJ2108838.1 zinc ribbon domain-containing protein [Methylobacterium sp. E-041]MCJ2110838.1 zinc ribbon domain-containing protein [Methylobacterium sp. E-025]TXM92877.1 zinc ribbon domain-containing protein [Methylobacterium sp. WL116]TXN38796.1 zinc ribbon domain-containing protein [Methylobacterium sp. WL93]